MTETSRSKELPAIRTGLGGAIDAFLELGDVYPDRIQRLFDLLIDLTNADQGVLIRSSVAAGSEIIAKRPDDLGQDDATLLCQTVVAAELDSVQVLNNSPVNDQVEKTCLAVPLGGDGNGSQWVAIIVVTVSSGGLLCALAWERAELIFGLARAHRPSATTSDAGKLASSSLRKMLFEPISRKEMLTKLCRYWEDETGAEKVVIGLVNKQRIDKLFTSNKQEKLASTTLGATFLNLMEEVLEQSSARDQLDYSTAEPKLNFTRPHNHQQLSTMVHPIKYDGFVRAVLLAEFPKKKAREGQERLRKELDDNLEPLVYRLKDLQRSSPVNSWNGLKKRTKTKVLIASLIAFILLGFLPINHQILAPFVIASTDKRIVVNPRQAILRTVMVRPGDRVKASQSMLAEMETTDIDLELAAAQAQRAEALTTSDLARSNNAPGKAQAALLQADAAQAKIDLLEYHRGLATIRAPKDGIILKSDTEKLIGSVIPQGQELFEVGSVDDLKVELFVPDQKIGELRKGAIGTLSMTSVPNGSFDVEVTRVYPIAEIRDGKNVFRAIAAFKSSKPENKTLKPGMEGVAWIEAGQRALADVLFGDLVRALRMKLWI